MNIHSLFTALLKEMTISEKIELRTMLEIDLKPRSEEHLYGIALDQDIIRIGRGEPGKGTQKLAAVKYYKDVTGLGLKEAKDYCDKLFQEHNM